MPFSRQPFLFEPEDVFRNRLDWIQVDRDAALRAVDAGLPVVVAGSHYGTASRFNPESPVYLSTGPYAYASLRYFVFRPLGGVRPRSESRSGGGSGKSKAGKPEAATQELELADLEPAESEETARASLFNLVWLKSSGSGTEEIESARMGEKILIQVESEGLMPGDSVRITLIRDTDGKEVAGLTARFGENRDADMAAVEWTPERNALNPGDRLIPHCRFTARNLTCKGTPLTLVGESRLGGVKIRFTDPLGNPMDLEAGRLTSEGKTLWEGNLPDGLLEVDELEVGELVARLEWEGRQFEASLPWQGYPLVEQVFPIYLPSERN